MNGIKVFKKGEFLFKEGEKVFSVLLVQSGSVHLHFVRGKQKIDFHQGSPHMILGEYALTGQGTHIATAVANSEVKVIEVPLEALRALFDSGTQLSKAVMKGMLDKLKHMTSDLKGSRLERDSSPCPPDQTAKIFGAVFHTAIHKGEKKGEKLTVDFRLMKIYAQRVFLESPKRLEQAVSIFVKLKAAELQMVKNEDEPDQPEEIGFVHFSDIAWVEAFFEYFQYYYFKGGKLELLKTDETAMTIVWALLQAADGHEADRTGIVRLDYSKVVEHLNSEFGIQLKGDHFSLLEMKGLLCKRQSSDAGISLQFELKEFQRVFKVWQVLREIGKWNETGSINMKDEWRPVKKVIHSGPTCTECEAPIQDQHKFCPSCGHKVQTAA